MLSLVGLWFILKGTGHITEELDRQDVLQMGRGVWRVNLGVAVWAAIWEIFLEQISALTLAGGIALLIVTLAVGLAGMLCILSYLGRAASAWERAVSPEPERAFYRQRKEMGRRGRTRRPVPSPGEWRESHGEGPEI